MLNVLTLLALIGQNNNHTSERIQIILRIQELAPSEYRSAMISNNNYIMSDRLLDRMLYQSSNNYNPYRYAASRNNALAMGHRYRRNNRAVRTQLSSLIRRLQLINIQMDRDPNDFSIK